MLLVRVFHINAGISSEGISLGGRAAYGWFIHAQFGRDYTLPRR